MEELKQLIKRYPELGDELAEFENRLLFLENSLPYKQEEKTKEQPIEPEWTRRQWAIVLQLKDQQEGFQKRFYEGLNEMKSTPKEKEGYSIKK